jgi:hypothetical protein
MQLDRVAHNRKKLPKSSYLSRNEMLSPDISSDGSKDVSSANSAKKTRKVKVSAN